jgi:hypothetical protein
MAYTEGLKTLKKIVFLTLPILILIGYLEYNLLQISNTYNLKKVYFEKELPSVETLVLGSSHVLNAINPRFLEQKAFNLANISQSLYYDIALTNQYIEKMSALKTVCVGISYFSFFAQLEDLDEEWRTFYYYYYWQLSCPHTQRGDMRKYSLIALYSNLTTLKYLSRKWQINEAPLLQANGFMPKLDIGNETLINNKTGFERFTILQNEKRSGRRLEIEAQLTEFVKTLSQKNIKVVLFSTPTYKTYRQYLNQNDLAENTLYIKALCEKYACKFVDFSSDSRFQLADFANNDHLNENGAEKFSTYFNNEVLKK